MSLINNAESALSIINQGIELAQSKGIFNLQDARLLADSIEFLTNLVIPKPIVSDSPVALNEVQETNPVDKKKIIKL
jgi:hypothetical protein